MELTLARQAGSQILVTCDNQSSHTFDLLTLLPHEKRLPQALDDPVGYGQALYQALFPPETLAQHVLANAPERILLVTTDNDLGAVAWEYAYGPDGFLVLECHFVRGLPAEQRINPPTLETSLHIVAIPSNPLSHAVEPLNIDGEWLRLKEIIQNVPSAITLERTRPPTIEQVRILMANQRHLVIHFMGHGGQDERGALLYFEQDNGDLDPVTAKQFVLRVRSNVFLVTLNACVSATPGSTTFSNLAASLVEQRTPYALGMRLSIPDEDARAFSRVFYNDLARGTSVEEALLQTRLTLANSPRPWVIGVPVLYTALTMPAAGFTSIEGTPTVNEHQPSIEVGALSRAEGAFQGRIDELKQLGNLLTGDIRPRIITIHGGGGQGKTALAGEAVERFAYAWTGGVWATTLENLPGREAFVNDLARFLGITIQEINDPAEIERQVLRLLTQHRTLIVLDNAETLIEAIRADNAGVTQLTQFIQQLPGPTVSLLVTSREHLGWSGEVAHEIGGLSSEEGANLFWQSAPQRANEDEMALAKELSQKLDGHPLSLRLLGGAFNASSISLQTFIKDYDAQLLKAENKYIGTEHRHRTLYASIETSVRYLDAELAGLFRKLWLFHAPFLPNTAAAIFNPEHDNTKEGDAPVYDHLYTLWRRGLLVREEGTVREGTVQFYRMLPTIRPYIEKYVAQDDEHEQLLARFGDAYAKVARNLYNELNRGGMAAFIAFQCREDLERGMSYVTGVVRGYYLLYWGWILQRVVDIRRGLKLIEQALEIGQGQDRSLELQALNNMALVYQATGQPKRALELYEQALPLMREVGNRAGEAVTLNNMAEVYRATGQPKQALELYEQALPITQEVGDRAGEAVTLNNMALVYCATGQPKRALELYEQALPLMREVGDRAGEAATLNNMAAVNDATGQLQQALELYEQALPITQEVGDRAGEATTLNNMAMVYQATGQPKRALELYEQALLLMREVGNRAGEAATLNNMALVYCATGQSLRALELYEQALPIRREVGDRAGEAATLNNMAEVYRATGQPQQALELYEQALPITQEVGDRAGEATTLNNMAMVYRATRQPKRALELYEQALPLMREVGNRAGEAATLNNMALVYQVTRQPQRALELLEQALPLMREVGNRAGEAATLNNMAMVYQATGQPKRALELYEQALPIRREVGDRAGEATTLNNMAGVYDTTGQPQQPLELYEQALPLMREVGNRAGEATTLANIALVLYRYLNRSQEAIIKMDQAIAVLVETGLPQDAAGRTKDKLQQDLDTMRQGVSPGQTIGGSAILPEAQIQQIVTNTVAVMTTMQERRAEWRETITKALQQVKSSYRQQDADFFAAVLVVLNGELPVLPGDHLYAPALAKIQEGVAAGGLEDDDIPQDDDLPFDAELVPRTVVALLGGPQEKMAHVQYLAAMDSQTTDEGLKVLIQTIQLGLFGSDLSQLGLNLSGIYREVWEAIVVGVETGGIDPRLFAMIIENTLAVLRSAADQLDEWRENLIQLKSQATEGDAQELVALLDAVIGLLDARGDPAGLGTNLIGIYAQTWQEIIENISPS